MSSPRYQYSYWAERIWACKRPMPARTFVPFDKRSLINFQQRSMCWVPHFTFTVFPPGNLWTFILTKFGLVHSHFPFFLTRFFWWTTESWRTPGSFILYALAESVWKITERLANHFLPKGPQSCFVMGPGPGDRVAVNVGLSRASTSVWGFPLWTNPHHCSQSMERSAFTSCSQAASDKAPCKPTGSKWSPFWTLQTIAARCLRRSGSRVGCTGTSCRKALFSSASKSDLGLSSAWLLLVATFNTTNAWLSFKVTRPCTGIDILSCMLTGGRVAMLRAESYKLWSEGGDASLWQRLTTSLKCKSSSDLRSKIED